MITTKLLQTTIKGLRLNPTDPDLHFSKAYLYDDSLDKPDLALTKLFGSCETESRLSRFNNNIALLYEILCKRLSEGLSVSIPKKLKLDPC